jgi:hypothetical protein
MSTRLRLWAMVLASGMTNADGGGAVAGVDERRLAIGRDPRVEPEEDGAKSDAGDEIGQEVAQRLKVDVHGSPL